MNFLKIDSNWDNPEARELEIVERKGLGHPDTLADALAERISTDYSRLCLDRFGAVLHHNIDKLYIGGGSFRSGFGYCEMDDPVKVVVNGRMSDRMGDTPLDLAEIQERSAKNYLSQILPHLDTETGITVIANSTQHTKRQYWFSPRDERDLPELNELKASDTSVYVAHWPFSLCEELAFSLEQYFWSGEGSSLSPRFNDVGQDIKCMVVRQGQEIDITVCLPLISGQTASEDDYRGRIEELERDLNLYTAKLIGGRPYDSTVKVNATDRMYLLGTGSCVEFGEEGLVGRGNTNSGVISVCRLHSMEASYGKNPKYHTGRVLGYLSTVLAREIWQELNVRCTVLAMAKNSQTLIPPAMLSVSLERDVDRKDICELVDRYVLETDYLQGILDTPLVR